MAINELQIPGIVLMENAGRGAAEVIRDLALRKRACRVVIFCGRGNNGGDGFVIARHLINANVDVGVYVTVPEMNLRGDADTNHRILRNMGVQLRLIDNPPSMREAAATLTRDDIVVDALLGTGFHGQVRSPITELIEDINAAAQAATVAVDTPSGLDCDIGRPGGVAIRADLTVTFVAEKTGFCQPGAVEWTGEVVVLGIGAPPSLIQRVLLEVPAADVGEDHR